jgi:hypothetical protein
MAMGVSYSFGQDANQMQATTAKCLGRIEKKEEIYDGGHLRGDVKALSLGCKLAEP